MVPLKKNAGLQIVVSMRITDPLYFDQCFLTNCGTNCIKVRDGHIESVLSEMEIIGLL